MKTRKWVRIAGGVLVCSYLVTWTFGVPRVLSGEAESAARKYGMGKSTLRDVDVGQVHPRIRFDCAWPILPGVIIVKHDYSVAYEWAWGGWTIHLWYGMGSKRLATWTRMMA